MKTIIATALIIAPMMASAGGLAPPLSERPQARPPAALSWGGPYVRLSFGRQTVTREESTITETRTPTEIEEPVTEECPYDAERGTHYGRKCDVSDHAGNADLNALPQGNWNGCDASVCAWRYDDEGNVTHIWLEDFEPFSFQTGTVLVPGPDIVSESASYFEEAFDASALGLSLGHRWQSGSIVYGGEVALTRNTDDDSNTASAEGTFGYSLGAALPYVSAGLASFEGETGAIYGAGVDLRITDSLFAGVKVSQSDDLGLEGVSASVGWKW